MEVKSVGFQAFLKPLIGFRPTPPKEETSLREAHVLLHPALFALCPWPSSLPLYREAGDAKQRGKGEGQPAGPKCSYWWGEGVRTRLELKRGKEGRRGRG